MGLGGGSKRLCCVVTVLPSHSVFGLKRFVFLRTKGAVWGREKTTKNYIKFSQIVQLCRVKETSAEIGWRYTTGCPLREKKRSKKIKKKKKTLSRKSLLSSIVGHLSPAFS